MSQLVSVFVFKKIFFNRLVYDDELLLLEVNPRLFKFVSQVELFHRRESLPDDYSLMDIAYIYAWKRVSRFKHLFFVFGFIKGGMPKSTSRRTIYRCTST